MKLRSIFALTVLGASVLGAAGCRAAAEVPSVPSTFTPSPCPPGWHRVNSSDPSDWGCLITGTLQPGQNLPLPIPVPSPSAAPEEVA